VWIRRLDLQWRSEIPGHVSSRRSRATTRKLLEPASFAGLQESLGEVRADETLTEKAVAELDANETALGARLAGEEFKTVLQDAVIELLPTFFYFSEYSILPCRVDLDEIAGDEELSAAPERDWTLRHSRPRIFLRQVARRSGVCARGAHE
jgi:hypothetical protein